MCLHADDLIFRKVVVPTINAVRNQNIAKCHNVEMHILKMHRLKVSSLRGLLFASGVKWPFQELTNTDGGNASFILRFKNQRRLIVSSGTVSTSSLRRYKRLNGFRTSRMAQTMMKFLITELQVCPVLFTP